VRMIEDERKAGCGDPEQEAQLWAEKLAECARLRAAYQDQQATGLMTIEELACKLGELEETRRHAERQLAALENYQDRIAELEADRGALFEYLEREIPERLDNLTGKERNQVYRRLCFEVKPTPEGYKITGVFCTKERMPSCTTFAYLPNAQEVENRPYGGCARTLR
jgi:hypothetical protein